MAAKRSPKSPSLSLKEAISRVELIYNEEGRNVFHDGVAVKHMGYNGLSGASRTTLAGIRGYGLIDGSGDLRVSDDAITIIADKNVSDQLERCRAMLRALKHNQIFKILSERFKDGSSEVNIASFLQKEHKFKPNSAHKTAKVYRDSAKLVFSNLQGYDEGNEGEGGENPDVEVGDLIQWVSQGANQFAEPQKVRIIDGQWLFVESSTTGIPMSQTEIVEKGSQQGKREKPPEMPLSNLQEALPINKSETEFSRGRLSSDVDYRLIVSGDMGASEIGNLIKLLEAQQEILNS